jgi:hypothetical protein
MILRIYEYLHVVLKPTKKYNTKYKCIYNSSTVSSLNYYV